MSFFDENRPLSLATRLLGLILGGGLTLLSIIFGFIQGVPVPAIILYALTTITLFFFGWKFVLPHFLIATEKKDEAEEGPGPFRLILIKYYPALIVLGLILIAFFILGAGFDGFLSGWTVASLVILLTIIVATRTIGPVFETNRSAFIGIMVLIGLFTVGAFNIEGFSSSSNIRSMLLFAAFLGMACVGQTLVALLGGLDLSIPFIIGASNVGMLYLISLGVPPWLAFCCVLVIGGLLGVMNGLLSFRLQGQALIVTLGTGFAISGSVQIITSIGTAYGGNVFGVVPGWLSNLAAMNGRTFGIPIPPTIVIWFLTTLILIVGMRMTVYGRYLYALGVNRISAKRVMISELKYWVMAYGLSGFFSALTGALLLGWSGGGFIGVGEQYLFLTLAAVVVGGTSLMGGQGGYGFTVIGVLVLQVLTSFLVGIGLDYEWQQFIFGLLIVPMVALYARTPHIRTQI